MTLEPDIAYDGWLRNTLISDDQALVCWFEDQQSHRLDGIVLCPNATGPISRCDCCPKSPLFLWGRLTLSAAK